MTEQTPLAAHIAELADHLQAAHNGREGGPMTVYVIQELRKLAAAGAVPDTGQARGLRVIHPRERDDMAAALHSAECDCGDRPHHERETGADYNQLATAAIKHARIASGDTVQAPDVAARLRAAATAGQDALPATGHLTDLDIAAAWEPALSALVDLADVLTPPHDVVASAVLRALLGTATTVGPRAERRTVHDGHRGIVAAFLDWLISMNDPEAVKGRAERQVVTLTRIIDRARFVRALLGTDTTPDRLAWIDTAAETAAVERQARYQETACARRPAEETPDA